MNLAGLRSRFSRVLAREEVYLANHSLGRPLDRMAKDVETALDLWYSQMDESWEPWTREMSTWRANVARLLGYSRSDSIVPKTSAGQGLRAVLNSFAQSRPIRIVATTGEFDSIDFILKTYAKLGRAEVQWVSPASSEGPVDLFTAQAIIDALAPSTDLVVLSKVFFTTGQVLKDTAAVIAAAHENGIEVVLDVYHAAGVIPLSLESEGADYAVGGSYKYLRGGPGACYLAVHPRILDANKRTLDTGWFAKKSTFGYDRSDEPEFSEGGDSWLESTPPVLMPYQAKSGLEFVLEMGVQRLRHESLEIQAELRNAFSSSGVPMFTPSDPEDFGAFSLLPSNQPRNVVHKLKDLGVSTDSRGPFVRFGPDILTTSRDIERAAAAVASTCRLP